MRKALKKYFKERTDAIDALMLKQAGLFTIEDFHQLRLEIKKIRAIAAMLQEVKDFKPGKILKPFKKIFIQAGKVREIQLEEATLKRYDRQYNLKSYLNHLHLQELHEKENFSGMHPIGNSRLKKINANVLPLIKKIHKSDLKKYMEKKRKKINNLIKHEKLETSQIHELRKVLKKFHYNIKSLDLKDNIFRNDDDMQELMGKWHDCRVIYWHLLKAMDNHLLTRAERKPILAIADKLNLRSRRLYEKINKEKQKIITRA